MHVIVIGAGVFGAWTARWYGPGNSLASSGDESRVTRSAHGPDDHYPLWQRRALEQWLHLDPGLFARTGVLWLARREDGFEAQSADVLERFGISTERLTSAADPGTASSTGRRWGSTCRRW